MSTCVTMPVVGCLPGPRVTEVCARDSVSGCAGRYQRIDVLDASCQVTSTSWATITGQPLPGQPGPVVDCTDFVEVISCASGATATTPSTPGVLLCMTDGTPIMVFANTLTLATLGWLNLSTGTYTAGNPPVGARACGEQRDVEIVNKLCVYDATGNVVGSAYTEITYDETGVGAPTYTLVGVDNAGTATRPFVLSGGQTLGVCDTSVRTFEKVVHFCQPVTGGPGICIEALALYSRSNTNAVTLNKVVQFDGTDVTANANSAGIFDGGCASISCVNVQETLIYLQQNTGTLTMADILTATGASRVLSVTIKQIAGTGAVNADTGGGVVMSTGETWSWSTLSDDITMDTLSSSALTFTAGAGGTQRVTATYLGNTAPVLPMSTALGAQQLNYSGVAIYRVVTAPVGDLPLFNQAGHSIQYNIDGTLHTILRDSAGVTNGITFNVPFQDYAGTIIGYAAAP